MYPRAFDYVAPNSLDEALSALGDDAKVIAGGMSLIPLMKMRLFSPSLLVDIGGIPDLDQITEHDDYIEIGALVRHAETAVNDLVGRHAPALATAASLTGDVQVRNRGTTCGALAHADVAADQPAGVLVHGATMIATSSTGSREIPANEFFVDSLTSALNTDEILTSVRIPKAVAGQSGTYDKLGRRGGQSDYAVAGVGAFVELRDGSVTSASIALTGVGLKPELSLRAAELLVGTDGSDAAIRHAAASATEDITVVEDLYGTEEYKRHLCTVYVARVLTSAIAAAS